MSPGLHHGFRRPGLALPLDLRHLLLGHGGHRDADGDGGGGAQEGGKKKNSMICF